MEKLTAIIPTGNEEHNIEAVLKSVSFADEVMVVDSFSSDRTVELARKHTDFIVQREYGNSASQKNWAIPQANTEWILLVDADERVTPELEAEIKAVLRNPDKDAYWIYRQNYLMGYQVNYSGWQGDKVIRLFRKSKARYEEKHVHSEMIVNGQVGYLKHKLDHYTYVGLDHYLAKSYRYSTWGAYDRAQRVKPVGFFQLVMKPFLGFVKKYFIKLGILDGKIGLVLALQYSSYLFTRALKIWRIQQGEKLKQQ